MTAGSLRGHTIEGKWALLPQGLESQVSMGAKWEVTSCIGFLANLCLQCHVQWEWGLGCQLHLQQKEAAAPIILFCGDDEAADVVSPAHGNKQHDAHDQQDIDNNGKAKSSALKS